MYLSWSLIAVDTLVLDDIFEACCCPAGRTMGRGLHFATSAYVPV
jgi:hypothetical protein